VSEEETPFVKHAFFAATRQGHVCAGNQFSFISQLSHEMKQKRALHNKPHNTGRKGYRGKRKEWEEEDAKLAAEGKQNP
jgi:hypothetical protein